MTKMDLNNFFDTGRKKSMFKATVREGTNALKFFISAYDKKEAESEAKRRIEEKHTEIQYKKISIEEVGKNKGTQTLND